MCSSCPSLSPSLLIEPWDVEYVSAVLFCFILDIVLCVKKKKKKLLIKKKKKDCIPHKTAFAHKTLTFSRKSIEFLCETLRLRTKQLCSLAKLLLSPPQYFLFSRKTLAFSCKSIAFPQETLHFPLISYFYSSPCPLRGSVVSYAPLGCIILIKNTVKP